jgi:Xaa-Pro aminopeptidase
MMTAPGGIDAAIKEETHVMEIETHLPHRRIDAVASTVRNVKGRKIGFDFGEHESISVAEYEILKSRLPSVTFVDATDLIRELKVIKSEREIEMIRKATDIQNRAFEKFFQRVGKGMSEVDIVAEMHQCQFECGATKLGVAVPWTHPGYALFRRQYPERVMKDGDLQWIDGGAVYHGYSSDYDIVCLRRA